jgi:ABC-type hemin transport system substrate-binding protein
MVRLSEEALLLADPAIYLVQRGAMNKDPAHPEKRPHFRNLAAVKRNFVRMVPESLYSRPGPHSVDAVEDLAAYIRMWRLKAGPSGPEGVKGKQGDRTWMEKGHRFRSPRP